MLQMNGGANSMRRRFLNVSSSMTLTPIERRGTTLFLLKQSAKATKQRTIRKKFPALDFRSFVKPDEEEKKDGEAD